jgi:signal transduction histidine kinase
MILRKLKSIEYSSLYPLFFTLTFIVILIQYSFFSLDAIFYDLWIKLDPYFREESSLVIVELDEESDQFLGESSPYTYASHARFIKRLLPEKPMAIGYLVNMDGEPSSITESDYLQELRGQILNYQNQGGLFRFGTNIEMMFGEVLPIDSLKILGYSPAFLFQDSQIFSKDSVVRRASLSISGEESFHLWMANQWLLKNGKNKKNPSAFPGSYYNSEADAIFALFRYSDNPTLPRHHNRISFHKVVTGNYPQDFFRDKIVLVGTKYVSNIEDFYFTPFGKDNERSSRISIHANIIDAFIHQRTIWAVPDLMTQGLAILIAVMLSFFISKVQPTKGLVITISLMLGTFAFGLSSFILLGWWFKLSHMMLGIFVVYYIWVPFRAIEEYQTRYAIQEEAKLLKQVDNLKHNFISLMSHDLKTPVAKIAGLADLLKEQYANNVEQKKLIDNIIMSTKELNSFITSILDLTKIESQNLTLKKESKDINKVIQSILEKLRFEIANHHMQTELELGPLYPIQFDTVLMNRVLSNLIENAIKYAGEGKTIFLKTWDDAEWIYVQVRDNGKGIARSDLQHIFDKFYRVKDDSSHSVKGSGLGLYLVRYFIELHGGEINATSEVGQGTAFTIKLPNV